MRKEILFIRHGESAANAGAVTKNPMDIPLTEKGKMQAVQVSLSFQQAPDLIVVSPFLRTQQTADPTVKRFACAQKETWSVQEFTYLAPETCIGTTAAERKERVHMFWDKNNPEYVDGEGAESFSQMLDRVKVMFHTLSQSKCERIAIFTHGQFMQAARLLISEKGCDDNIFLMKRFKEFEKVCPIGNGEIFGFYSRLGG